MTEGPDGRDTRDNKSPMCYCVSRGRVSRGHCQIRQVAPVAPVGFSRVGFSLLAGLLAASIRFRGLFAR